MKWSEFFQEQPSVQVEFSTKTETVNNSSSRRGQLFHSSYQEVVAVATINVIVTLLGDNESRRGTLRIGFRGEQSFVDQFDIDELWKFQLRLDCLAENLPQREQLLALVLSKISFSTENDLWEIDEQKLLYEEFLKNTPHGVSVWINPAEQGHPTQVHATVVTSRIRLVTYRALAERLGLPGEPILGQQLVCWTNQVTEPDELAVVRVERVSRARRPLVAKGQRFQAEVQTVPVQRFASGRNFDYVVKAMLPRDLVEITTRVTPSSVETLERVIGEELANQTLSVDEVTSSTHEGPLFGQFIIERWEGRRFSGYRILTDLVTEEDGLAMRKLFYGDEIAEEDEEYEN